MRDLVDTFLPVVFSFGIVFLAIILVWFLTCGETDLSKCSSASYDHSHVEFKQKCKGGYIGTQKGED